MKKRSVIPAVLLSAVAVMFASVVPANAATTYSVGVIQLSNKEASPKALAIDSRTGNLYVGQQDGASGATIAALDNKGKLRTYIRVGEGYDPASNLPPDGESPPPYAPTNVIALTINARTNTLLALVTSKWINTRQTYSALSGTYVVAVNMRSNAVVKRYTVAQLSPESGAPDVETMWTGFALDASNNALWGVEGYDPTFSDAIDRLNLTTGVQTRAALPVVANDTPIDAVPTIAYSERNRRAYVSVAGVVFGISRNLTIATTLRLPGRLDACAELTGSAPTAIASSPSTSTIYVNFCSTIHVINGRTNSITRLIPTAPYSRGLALDNRARTLFTYETRNSITGVGVYRTGAPVSAAFVPLTAINTYGNAWMVSDPHSHKTYVTSTKSTISQIQRQ